MGLGETALVAAIVYHAFNGIRIILIDFWGKGNQLAREHIQAKNKDGNVEISQRQPTCTSRFSGLCFPLGNHRCWLCRTSPADRFLAHGRSLNYGLLRLAPHLCTPSA